MSTIFSERLFLKLKQDFEPNVKALGIDPAIFSDPATELPIEKYMDLLETTARRGTPYIGLKMAGAVEMSDFGVLGYAMRNAKTIQKLLETLTKYIYVFAQDNMIQFDVAESAVIVRYRFLDESISQFRQDVEFALGTIKRVIETSTPWNIIPKFVEFEHPLPDYVEVHRNFFQCPVYFGRGGNRLHYAKSILPIELVDPDPRLFEALEFYLADKLKLRDQDNDLLTRVRHVITTSLYAGVPELPEVARKIGMSPRTLQRRLLEAGVVFSDLVDITRKNIACEYVAHTDYKFSDIGGMVGYHEASSFTRAFKRWTGSTPQALRKHTSETYEKKTAR
ncbi:MAG TPA: AraC family transcriptional regulator [Hyphomonas sp.]|nr:AraC family transcriptional regulator [Hyphomonas sp.]